MPFKTTQKSHEFGLPDQEILRLERLGRNIKLARKRRSFSSDKLSRLAGVSRSTISRLEQGHPGVALGVLLKVLWILGLSGDFDDMAAPEKDLHGRALERLKTGDKSRYAF